MRKILFVQPDERHCELLKASLYPKLNQWHTSFAAGAIAGFAEMEASPWDIVIANLQSDDDKSFFFTVREAFPAVVRIGLVNQTRSSLPVASLVHQFLMKPFRLEELAVAVERSCRLRELLDGEMMSRTVGDLGDLPSAPTVYMKLVEKLDQPDTSIEEIAEIVESDVAISVKLLRLVNSALFRTSREIATVQMAASYLGLNIIKNLVLSTEVYSHFEKGPKIPGFSIEELQVHSRLTADIAKSMNLTREIRDAAIVASLLHDVGKLVLAWKVPVRMDWLISTAADQQRPLFQIEEELWGITHAEIGAYLLSLWGLPTSITEAIAYHHAPDRVPHCHFDALGAVYAANLLAHEQDGSATDNRDLWDYRFLKEMGVSDELPRWKVLAEMEGLKHSASPSSPRR
jgi:HD-like signal output (HDOD) protein